MKKAPKVSFLLLNWNGIDFTRKCLKSLLKTSYPNYEIVVVDNGSENHEADTLENEFSSKIRLVRSKINLGYAAGMNLAIQKSSAEYVMILNNDMEFGKQWIEPLVEVLEKNDKVAACQPKLKDLKNKKYFEHGGAAGGFFDILGYPFARGRIFSAIEQDNGQYEHIVKVGWAGVILARKSVLKKIGFFNTIYFNYGEDMDLCFRIYGLGYSVVNVPQSVVYHYGSGILRKNMPRKTFFHHRNNIVFLLINFRWPTLAVILLPRIVLDFISIFYYVLDGYKELGFSVVRAYWSLLFLLPKVYDVRKRSQILIKKEHLINLPIYKGSIVWDYFVRKKKKFSEVMDEKNLEMR